MASDRTPCKPGLFTIIVLNYNRINLTKQTIKRLLDVTTLKSEWLFVDNGSIDGTREYLKDIEKHIRLSRGEDARCLFNHRNMGVAGGKNVGLKLARGEYIYISDDDILVPDDYDILLKNACDKVENLGVTGINLERKKFALREVNGVRLTIKKGNLGGGSLCFPRRVFDRVGYFAAFSTYGGEDLDMYERIKKIKLINAYIEPWGVHLDDKSNKEYVKLKKKVHRPSSPEIRRFSKYIRRYKKGRIYVSYNEPTGIDFRKYDKVLKKG